MPKDFDGIGLRQSRKCNSNNDNNDNSNNKNAFREFPADICLNIIPLNRLYLDEL